MLRKLSPLLMGKALRTASIAALALSAFGITLIMLDKQRSNPTLISIYHPYRPIFPLDPRKIITVGDQVIAEHVFAFHAHESMKNGFASNTSTVVFDRGRNEVHISPRFALLRSDGSPVTAESICTSIKASFQGTQHSPYRKLFKSTRCEPNGTVVVELAKIPANLPFLMTLPDFSLFEPESTPITPEKPPRTTGPYTLEKVAGNEVWLRRNKHYPRELTANDVERVVYRSYSSSEVTQLVSKLDPNDDHLLYFSGDTLTPRHREALTAKGYRLQVFPSEGVLYLRLHSRVSATDKTTLLHAVSQIRPALLKESEADIAYSITPSDRPFGLNRAEFEALSGSEPSHLSLSKPLSIGIVSTWQSRPICQELISRLQGLFPSIRVNVYEPKDWTKIDEENDISPDFLGISPADPLSHLSFLSNYDKNFAEVVSEERITRIAQLDDADEFNREIKKVEAEILAKRLIIPIAHFPGIVAEAPGFERDESLAWSWGTQAWTYRIR